MDTGWFGSDRTLNFCDDFTDAVSSFFIGVGSCFRKDIDDDGDFIFEMIKNNDFAGSRQGTVGKTDRIRVVVRKNFAVADEIIAEIAQKSAVEMINIGKTFRFALPEEFSQLGKYGIPQKFAGIFPA